MGKVLGTRRARAEGSVAAKAVRIQPPMGQLALKVALSGKIFCGLNGTMRSTRLEATAVALGPNLDRAWKGGWMARSTANVIVAGSKPLGLAQRSWSWMSNTGRSLGLRLQARSLAVATAMSTLPFDPDRC